MDNKYANQFIFSNTANRPISKVDRFQLQNFDQNFISKYQLNLSFKIQPNCRQHVPQHQHQRHKLFSQFN